jgi:hypothetical protein
MASLMKQKTPSNMTLYGIGLGVLMLGGTIVSVKNQMFPEPLARCTARYASTIDFPSQAPNAQPVNVREVQTRLGFDEWGLVENVTLEPNKQGAFPFVLEVALPEGASGKQPGAKGKGGVSFSWKSGVTNASAVCLSYGVRLPPNFDFDKGGVLPGLYGGEDPRNGKTGFAARLAWGPNGSGDVVANLPGTGERGVSLTGGAWRFPTGRWVLIEQEVRLNTPGRPDGTLAMWIDGVLRAEAKNVAFRGHQQVGISGVLSDIYYAAPAPTDTSLQITNFNFRWQ